MFIHSVLDRAKAPPTGEADPAFVQEQLEDRQFLTNKTDIGAHFAVHKGMSNVENAMTAMGLFDGTPAGLDGSIAAIDNFYASALDPATGEFLMPLIGVINDPFA